MQPPWLQKPFPILASYVMLNKLIAIFVAVTHPRLQKLSPIDITFIKAIFYKAKHP